MEFKRQHHGLSWPRPDGSDQVACHSCDTLQNAPPVVEGEAAHCGQCGELLYQNRPRSLARATAYSSAALILMVLVHGFPFLTMATTGIHTELTLMQSVHALAKDRSPILSMAVVFFTIVAPLGLALSLCYVAAPLRHGRVLPGAVTLTRWLQFFQPWSMLEVFLLGLVVSLLKLGHIAEIKFGIGLWALSALVICLAAALSGIDRLELWDRIEVALKKRKS
ncbi:paraquat-inducible protein A [Haloferula sp.]|uniref:paraquat-inducible protein A n=1 Tax=Haloferula sp. TaxID=2497595 RepID=UPI003C78CE8B